VVRRRAEIPVQPEVWEGPIYGEVGVLETDGTRAECHICGRWYRLLGGHVFQAHGLWADTYRRLFGLRQRTGLAGEALRAQHRRAAARLSVYHELARQTLLALSPEERSANARQRVVPPEATRDPTNRARWRQNIAKAQAAQSALWRTPAYRERMGQRLSEARGGRVGRTCPICGCPFAVPRAQARAARQSCGQPACMRELRRRIAREIAARADVRGRVVAGMRRHTGWPPRERIQELAPATVAALSERDAALVRRFYGLPNDPAGEPTVPLTLDGLADAFALTPREVRRQLGRILEQLLGEPVLPRRRRGASSCVVCGEPIRRRAGEGPRTTCGPACLRTFRAELARSTVLRPDARERAARGNHQKVATPEGRAAWRAHIQAARRRARPVAAALHALEPVELDRLPAGDREVLVRYYGLGGHAPRTLNEVAQELGLSKFRAAQAVRRAVAALLGPQAVPAELGGRVSVACAVCEAPVELSPSLAGKARTHTCGPTCRAEFSRRRLRDRGLQDDPAVHERARVSIMLRKGRPHAAAILALPPEAIDALPELRRSLVRAYYGLDGTPLCSYQDLGPRFGLSGTRAGELVRDAVARLLAPR